MFDYDSLPISFQSGVTFPLVALDKIYFFKRKEHDPTKYCYQLLYLVLHT